MTNPFSLAKRHATLLDPESSTYEDALDLVDKWQAMKEAYKVLDKLCKDSLRDYAQKRGDLYHPGTRKRYYAGQDSTTKRKAPIKSVHEAVLEACGGDEETYLTCLASEAFKQGTVKKLVGKELHASLYEKKVETVLVPKDWNGKRGKDLKFEIQRKLMEIKEG